MARNAAVDFNIPTAYVCTLGNVNEIVNLLISSETGIPNERLSEIGTLTGDEAANFEQNLKTICNAPVHICTTTNSLNELFAAIRSLVKDKGVRVVYIDEIESLYNESIYESTNFNITLRFLKYVAQRFGIAIIVAHSFDQEKQNIDDEEPSIKTLRKSGISDKFADMVVMLHYKHSELLDDESEIGKTKVIVGKNIFGGTGEFFIRYNFEKRLFENYIDSTPELEDILLFRQNDFVGND
jgi:replicative DNA helicase